MRSGEVIGRTGLLGDLGRELAAGIGVALEVQTVLRELLGSGYGGGEPRQQSPSISRSAKFGEGRLLLAIEGQPGGAGR